MTAASLGEALERRAWRLAYLLTGNGAAASRVLGRVAAASAHVPRNDPARLDRLVIVHVRELAKRRRPALEPAPSGSAEAGVSGAMRALLGLPEQPREAWVLSRLDGLDGIRMSRAMDCSRTAAERHLAAADEGMRARLGEGVDAAVGALRAFADALDPGPAVEVHRSRERRKRRVRTAMIALGVLGLALAAGVAVFEYVL